MRVSLRDVALRAGVSINTASGVLNGRGNARISAATRERVRTAADALGYHPNLLAGSLRSGKTFTIGLILSDLGNPHYLRILQVMERMAGDAGYRILLDAVTRDGRLARGAGFLRGWPVDGVLLCTREPHDIRTFLGPQADGMPAVYLGFGSTEDPDDVVAFDLFDGGRQAARHLIERGCRRIVFVTPFLPAPPRPDLRYSAYEEVCREAGQEPEIVQVSGKIDAREAGLDGGARIAERPRETRPDGILCHNDLIAIGVYRALRRAGIGVPDDIRVAGFDNIADIRYMETPLTTVDAPVEELCAAALKLLLARIEGGEPEASPPILIPTRLIPGGSS